MYQPSWNSAALFIKLVAAAAGCALASPAGAAGACKPPPPAVKSLQLTRFYSDKAGTRIDPRLKARHKAEVRPLTAFLRYVVKQADKSLRQTNKERAAPFARCALSWITAWADAAALLGAMGSKQAQYQRKWDMTGLALAYLKIRRFANSTQRAVIEPWLVKLADRSRAFFDHPGRRRNNHWYWLGLGVGATALATGSQRHWQMARGIFRDAARDIGADGSLKYEMARRSRALKYHAFAAMALVVLAELARSRGEDWYAFGDGALHRLVSLCVSGLRQPALFQKMTGHAQKRPIKPGAGWLPLYARRFADRLPDDLPTMKPGHRWLGGNVILLNTALSLN